MAEKNLVDIKTMRNEKKLLDKLITLESAAKVILSEVANIRAMFEVKEPVKVDKDTIRRINFYRTRELNMQRARNKKSLARSTKTS